MRKTISILVFSDLHPSDRPSLIFHDETKHVYLTEHAPCSVSLSSRIYHSKDHFRRSSPCENCSSLLSPVQFTEYFHSFLIANVTYNLMQMFLDKRSNQRDQFGYISSINAHQIEQIVINNSKLSHSSDLNVHSTKYSLVLRVQSWPKEICSNYEQRHRLWPTNISSLFQSTCFIRSQGTIAYQTSRDDQCSNCQQTLSSISGSSWSYTYAAVEDELVRLMSDGHKRFASIGWNYLQKTSHGQLSFAIFKHTLFYFFEGYSLEEFRTHDFTDQLSSFLRYLLYRFQTESIPHYFNSHVNLFNANLPFDWLTIPIISPHTSIYTLPDSSLYLSHLFYLIEFQSKFLDEFPSIKSNITQSILDAHRYALERISIPQHSITLDCLYQYQQSNVQIILDYLPAIRLQESSLLLHVFWSIFIQYFNPLFDELFLYSNNNHSSQVNSSSSR